MDRSIRDLPFHLGVALPSPLEGSFAISPSYLSYASAF